MMGARKSYPTLLSPGQAVEMLTARKTRPQAWRVDGGAGSLGRSAGPGPGGEAGGGVLGASTGSGSGPSWSG